MQNGWLCRSANLSSNDPICVANAGAVLLWPYLPRFFDQVGLLEEGKFLSACARVRGVMLVQYLVTGSAETQELKLTLVLSHFCSGLSAHLGGLSFESQGAFSTQR